MEPSTYPILVDRLRMLRFSLPVMLSPCHNSPSSSSKSWGGAAVLVKLIARWSFRWSSTSTSTENKELTGRWSESLISPRLQESCFIPLPSHSIRSHLQIPAAVEFIVWNISLHFQKAPRSAQDYRFTIPSWRSLLLPFSWGFANVSIRIELMLVGRSKVYHTFFPSPEYTTNLELFGQLRGQKTR